MSGRCRAVLYGLSVATWAVSIAMLADVGAGTLWGPTFGTPRDLHAFAAWGLSLLGAGVALCAVLGALPAPAPRREPRQPSGPDLLDAWVHGDGIPALREAALGQARDLFGPDAELEVERMGRIDTSLSREGAFCAHVHVRCLSFPEEDR